MRPAVLAVVSWAVGAATAITVGLVALSSVGTFDGPSDPLARTGDQAPAADAPGPATPTNATTPSPAVTATDPPRSAVQTTSGDKQLTSAGGSVVARCVGGDAYLVIWSPAQGFHAGAVTRGPTQTARVTFEGHG